jgi:hypothetical protein
MVWPAVLLAALARLARRLGGRGARVPRDRPALDPRPVLARAPASARRHGLDLRAGPAVAPLPALRLAIARPDDDDDASSGLADDLASTLRAE